VRLCSHQLRTAAGVRVRTASALRSVHTWTAAEQRRRAQAIIAHRHGMSATQPIGSTLAAAAALAATGPDADDHPDQQRQRLTTASELDHTAAAAAACGAERNGGNASGNQRNCPWQHLLAVTRTDIVRRPLIAAGRPSPATAARRLRRDLHLVTSASAGSSSIDPDDRASLRRRSQATPDARHDSL
jgi:hypothetical protein